MTGRSAPGIVRATHRTLVAAIIALTFNNGVAWSADDASKSGSQQLDEVVVSAHAYDRHTLVHDIVPHFVESHSAPSTNIDQVARWRAPVCPQATGLQTVYSDFVTRQIITAAQSVGAPNNGVGKKCGTNIEIAWACGANPACPGRSRFQQGEGDVPRCDNRLHFHDRAHADSVSRHLQRVAEHPRPAVLRVRHAGYGRFHYGGRHRIPAGALPLRPGAETQYRAGRNARSHGCGVGEALSGRPSEYRFTIRTVVLLSTA
jgi:hypothetical protein